MSAQRHVVKRQVIELEVRGGAPPQPLQDEISRIYRARIVPLIDQRCSEFSAPGRLHRIDTLELDVGRLDPRRLEEDLVEKVDAALRRALSAQIDAQEGTAGPAGGPQTQSQLELFALFARTGSLPWWAEASRPGLLAENLEGLLRDAPEALRPLLRELLVEERPRRRLVLQYNDGQLAALCGLLVTSFGPMLPDDLREACSLLQEIEPAGGTPPARLRRVFWHSALLAAVPGGQAYTGVEAFHRAVLQRVAATWAAAPSTPGPAARTGGREAALLAAMRRVIRDGRAGGRLAGLLERLAGAQTAGRVEPGAAAVSRRLAHWQPAGGPLASEWAALRRLAARFPPALQRQWLSAIEGPAATATLHELARRLLELLPPDSARPAGLSAAKRAEADRILRTVLTASQDRATEARAEPAGAPLDLHFSEDDALPVVNAGLVILWPFLDHFFERLGLLDEDRQFKDDTARQRAAGLLQVLGTGDPEPAPEYLIPLNKLLCGLELDQVFDFGPPLSETEAAECAALLEAVIERAPILRDMSPDGFRGSFLLRPGLLSAGDGFWLLRVERQTFDILLDRFPWGWEWVKLSWMDAPLRVEW